MYPRLGATAALAAVASVLAPFSQPVVAREQRPAPRRRARPVHVPDRYPADHPMVEALRERQAEREAKRAAAWRRSVLNYSPRGVVPAWAGAIISTFRFSAVDELVTALAEPAGVVIGALYVGPRDRRVRVSDVRSQDSVIHVVFHTVDADGNPTKSRPSERSEADFLADFKAA